MKTLSVLLLLGLVVCSGALSPPALGAAYIKFDGIDGESRDAVHTGWSEVLQFDHAILRPHLESASRQRGDVQHQDFAFTKELDKASPKLAEACLKGQIFPRVVIELQSEFDNPFIWKRITFGNATISGFERNASSDNQHERYTLNYEKIHWKYVPRDPNGQEEPPVSFGWDQIANLPFDPEQTEPNPTPTPVVGPGDPTPTPVVPSPGVVFNGDLLNLYEDEFRQKAVIVKRLDLSQDPPGISDIFSEQFYAMATLPDGSVLTNVKRRNLEETGDEALPPNADILVRITQEGEMVPFAHIKAPELLVDGEALSQGESTFLNLSFDGKDEISVLARVNGRNNRSNAPYAAVVLVKIIGPFDASSVGSFRVY